MRDCFHEEENATACGTKWEKSAKTLARLRLSRENYAVLTGSAEERAESDVLHQAGVVSLSTQGCKNVSTEGVSLENRKQRRTRTAETRGAKWK